MSLYTHILICWEGGHVLGYANQKKIKEIAGKYLQEYEKNEKEVLKLMDKDRTEEEQQKYLELDKKTVSYATQIILDQIASGKALFEGSKGWLWMCGGIFNYTEGDTVLNQLKDFFKELWDNKCFGRGNVVCFSEMEQHHNAQVFILDVSEKEIHEAEEGKKWCWGLDW